MGGGSRSRRQKASETASTQAVEQEKQRAAGLQIELQKRRDILGTGLPETLQATQTGAQDLRATGGYNLPAPDLTGRGYEGYQNFATTGGFNPGEKEQFLRRASAPVAAVYSRANDELSRQKAIQGGYMPGYIASTSRINREAATKGAEASLGANVDLATQVRQGQLAGLGGMERVKGTAVGEAQRTAESVQRGKIAGQDALQKYSQFGAAALSDIDINEMRNALQTGNMTEAHAQLLAQLAAQDKPLFDKIMQGIGTIGGATAGILSGIGSLTSAPAH